MLIKTVLQTKFKLGSGPSELNEMLVIKAPHLNYAHTVCEGNVYVVLFVIF